MTDILEFRGPTRWLSNFHFAPIHQDGFIYPTNEHYYQANRSNNKEDHERIRLLPTPKEAMDAGCALIHDCKERSDWHDIKLGVMLQATLLKYTQHLDLTNKLLATGKGRLVEGNYWNDIFWGECPIGTGENHLGKTIIKVRSILQRLRGDYV